MDFQIDTQLLSNFVVIAESSSFTQAAHTVGKTQAALSLQIKKLEEMLRCPLFLRNSRRVSLTTQGQVFLGYARRILSLQWELYNQLTEPDIKGAIRLGLPEDFTSHDIPEMLSHFLQQNPQIDLQVHCALTLNLVNDFKKGDYDIILFKHDQQNHALPNTYLWREPLVWAAADHYTVEPPFPLVMPLENHLYRERALQALAKTPVSWRIVYTCPSIAGTLAAAKARLGITAVPISMLSPGLQALTHDSRLPPLPDIEVVLACQKNSSKAVQMLADYLVSRTEKAMAAA